MRHNNKEGYFQESFTLVVKKRSWCRTSDRFAHWNMLVSVERWSSLFLRGLPGFRIFAFWFSPGSAALWPALLFVGRPTFG